MIRFLLFFMLIVISFLPAFLAVRLKDNTLIGITVVTGLFSVFIVPWIVGMILVCRRLPQKTGSLLPFGAYAGYWGLMLFFYLILPFLSYGLGTVNGYQFFLLSGYSSDAGVFTYLFLAALLIALTVSLFLRKRNLFIGEIVLLFLVAYTFFWFGFVWFGIVDVLATHVAGFGFYVLIFMIYAATGFTLYHIYREVVPEASADTRSPLPVIKKHIPEKVSLYIRCRGGVYTDAVFTLKEGETLTMGTDPAQANLVFSSPEISRLHCSICCSGARDRVRITDTSTNGTYISNGNRLPAKVPVEIILPCTIFFGSEPQVFELSLK